METIKDKVAIAGIGETTYYKRGTAPVSEFRLACDAIIKAADDAGIKVTDIDGFASYADDRNDASRLATALGIPHLSFANMFWGGGGGGGSGAVANAAAGVAAGCAKNVVVFRALAQGQFGRFGQGSRAPSISGPAAYTLPYGLMSAAQMFAMKVQRFMYDHHVKQDAFAAVALASYHHAVQSARRDAWSATHARGLLRIALDR